MYNAVARGGRLKMPRRCITDGCLHDENNWHFLAIPDSGNLERFEELRSKPPSSNLIQLFDLQAISSSWNGSETLRAHTSPAGPDSFT